MLAPCEVGRRLFHADPAWQDPCERPGSIAVTVDLGAPAVLWLCGPHVAEAGALDGEPVLLPPGGAQGRPEGLPGQPGQPGQVGPS